MFELNGKQFTLEQVKEAAEASNMTVEQYIAKAGLNEVGKAKPVAATTATAPGQNLGSQFGNGSLAQSGTSGSTLDLDQVADLSEQEVYEIINELNKSKYNQTYDDFVSEKQKNKKDAFSKGKFKKEEEAEYLEYKQTGELKEDPGLASEYYQQAEANERVFMENLPFEKKAAVKEYLGQKDPKNVALDAFERSYSQVDQIANLLAGTGVDIALGGSYLADMLAKPPEEGEDAFQSEVTKSLIEKRQKIEKERQEKLPKPIPLENINSLDGLSTYIADAWVNFVPSAAALATGPGAIYAFGAMGAGGRLSQYALEEAEAKEYIPELQKALEIEKDPVKKEQIEKDINRYNDILTTSNLTKLATAGIYAGSEMLFEKLSTIPMANELAKAAKLANPVDKIGKEVAKKLLLSPIKESAAEGATQITQNFADIALNNADINLLDNVGEAAVQGAIIGNGFAVGQAAAMGRAKMMHTIASKGEKQNIQNGLSQIDGLAKELDNPEITKERKDEIKNEINSIIKDLSANEDLIADRFLKLSIDEKKEVFELQRKSEEINRKWTNIAADSQLSESTKETMRTRLFEEFNSLQNNKRSIIESADKRYKALTKIEGLSEGDQIRNKRLADVYLRKVRQHQKIDKNNWLKSPIIGVSETDLKTLANFVSQKDQDAIQLEDGSIVNKEDANLILENSEGRDGLFDPNSKLGVVFTDRARYGNSAAAIHEYMHGALEASGMEESDFNKIKNDLIELIENQANGKITKKQSEDIINRINQYSVEEGQDLELLTSISDFIARDVISEKDKNLFSRIRDGVKSMLSREVGVETANEFNMSTAEDAFDFVKNFNRKILKKSGDVKITKGQALPEEKDKKPVRPSKLQPLLDSFDGNTNAMINQTLLVTPQGKETFDFTKSKFGQEIGGMVESITRRLYDPIPEDAKRVATRDDYKNALITSAANLVTQEYNPELQDLDSFISNRLNLRANRVATDLGIESVQEFGGTGIKADVTEAKGITADEVEITANTKKLVDAIGVSKSILDKGRSAIERAIIKAENAIVGKDLTQAKKIKARDKALNDVLSQQLEKDLKKEFLKTAKNNNTFNDFLDKNWKEVTAVYLKNTNVNKIPEGRGKEILQGWNEQFPSKQEVVDYFQGKDLDNKQAISNRKNRSLANAIVKEITNDVKEQFVKEDPKAAEDFKAKTGILFSKQLLNIVDKPLFELEQKGVDQLLNSYDLNSTAKYKTEEQINNAILDIKNKLLPLMPRKFWFGPAGGSAFTGSSKIIGVKTSSDPLWAYFVGEIKKLSDLPDSSFGAEIEGVDFKVSSYKTLFKDEATIKKNIINGSIDEFNTKVSKIHEAFWNTVNEAITNDKSIAPIIGSYLKIVGNDTKHWHKLGAQFVGYSTNPKGRYEYEHAMPATAAYLYLMDAALSDANFNAAYKAVIDNYKLIALDKAMDKKLTAVGLQRKMPKGWDLTKNFWWERYFNPEVASIDGGIPTESLIFLNGKTATEELNVLPTGVYIAKANLKNLSNINKTRVLASKSDKPVKKIRIFDFDDTLARSNSQVLYTLPNGTKGKLNATEYAKKDEELKEQGAEFDFSEFSKVIDGKKGPLFNVAKKIADAKGNEDLFILTARPADAAGPIQEFLKLAGLNFKKDNIVGLGDGAPQAKANWVLSKTAEGYNDFYFADDAVKNVKAVKDILDTVDVKSRAQRVLASKNLDKDFNDLLERVKGVKSEARYSEDRATKLGNKNKKFKFFIPYSAEDYIGLIYPTLGKGTEGDKNLEWYKKNIINPYARGIRDFETAKQAAMNQWAELKKRIKKTPANLKKESVRGFSNEEAIRVYLWNQKNVVPDTLAKKDVEELVKHVESNQDLLNFANQVNDIVGESGYPSPQGDWLAGTITTDLVNHVNTVSRAEYLKEWQENVDIVYSKDNMNKLKAIYGESYTEALQDMLYRMKTGRNRPSGANKLTNQFMNWVNDSVGTIMFFNTRSALLQTISSVNYLNFADNNPIKAAAAFTNQKQFWSDFSELFNSDFLKQRRSGLKTDVNADEIAKMASTAENKIRAGLSAILKKGFLPTQIADSFAISIGGASFYRNRINTYLKDGMTEAEAKEQAFLDFQEITEESQQSSRPDRVSMQQASPLGRVVLAFANTPMQYARLTKKAALDLVNGRGDWKANMSKLLYYGAVQNIIFTYLQQAMFAMMFSDDDEEEEKNRYFRAGNSIADSLLRGIGVGGAAIATLKNLVMKTIDEYKSGRPDYTDVAIELTTISPPVNSKLRKLNSAGRAFTYKQSKEKMRTEGFSLDNPAFEATGQIISALANVPADRAVRKMNNLKTAFDPELEMWQSIALALGYSKWDVGIKNSKSSNEELIEKLKTISKIRKIRNKRKKSKKSSPVKKLEDGVLGKAHKDGTIEIKEGLSPAKKKEVIAHEKKHIADMKSGKLNYDDQNVYWNGKPYPRLQGKKIVYNGVAYLEGHKKLPWEKSANNTKS